MFRKKINISVLAVVVVLVLGVIAISRLNFSAAKTDVSLSFQFERNQVRPTEKAKLNISYDPGGEVEFSAVQISLEYNDQLLTPLAGTASPGYLTKVFKSENGRINWLLVPEHSNTSAAVFNTKQSLGEIEFLTLAEGVATFRVDPAQTLLAAFDYTAEPTIYDALVSYQVEALRISMTAPTASVKLPTAADSLSALEALDGTGLQRLNSLEVIPLADAAIALISAKYSTGLTLLFGENAENLDRTLVVRDSQPTHLIRLLGLKPSSRYYYQVQLNADDGSNSILTRVRSFVTTATNSTDSLSPNKTEVRLTPSLTKDEINLVVVPLSQSSELVDAPLAVSLEPADVGITISEAQNFSGAKLYTLQSQSDKKQTVTLTVESNSQKIATTKATFDPDYVAPVAPRVILNQPLSMSNPVLVSITILLIFLLVGALLGYRVIRR